MKPYLNVILVAIGLVIPTTVNAQDRDRTDRNNEQQDRHYEDKAHNDSHEWNDAENQAYRRYLQEHHKKYHDFAKASKKEQSDYWDWRHSHPDNDRH